MTIQIGVDDENRIMLAKQYAGDPRPSFAFVTNDGGECCCPTPAMACSCKNWDAHDLHLGTEYTANGSNVATALDLGSPAHSTIDFLPRFDDWLCADKYDSRTRIDLRTLTATERELIGSPWPMTYDPMTGQSITVNGRDDLPAWPATNYTLHGVATRPRWRHEETFDGEGDWRRWHITTGYGPIEPVRVTRTATLWLANTVVATAGAGSFAVYQPKLTPDDMDAFDPFGGYTVNCHRLDACTGGPYSDAKFQLWATLKVVSISTPVVWFANIGFLVTINCGVVNSSTYEWWPKVGYFPYTVENRHAGREWTYLRGA